MAYEMVKEGAGFGDLVALLYPQPEPAVQHAGQDGLLPVHVDLQRHR